MRALLRCSGLLLAAALALAAGVGRAQQAEYPVRALRLIVPFPPGGATDLSARAVAERLGQRLGQPVVVENKSGASGTIGADAAARAPADGYTLLLATVGTHAIGRSLNPDLPYDPVADFTPVILLSKTPNVLVVPSELPVTSVAELLALARAEPGALAYGSSGSGTSTHLSAALFESLAGVRLQHVPYRGSGPMLLDLMSGQVSLAFDNLSGAIGHIRSGRLRALAVTTAVRAAVLPDVPTLAEVGVQGYEASYWNAVFVPAATPAPIAERLSRELDAVLRAPETRDFFAGQGAEAGGGTPAELAAFLRAETAKWAEVVRISGAKSE
jgi:tripartite-type tricarboxylate transporter receptor subunit TctC